MAALEPPGSPGPPGSPLSACGSLVNEWDDRPGFDALPLELRLKCLANCDWDTLSRAACASRGTRALVRAQRAGVGGRPLLPPPRAAAHRLPACRRSRAPLSCLPNRRRT